MYVCDICIACIQYYMYSKHKMSNKLYFKKWCKNFSLNGSYVSSHIKAYYKKKVKLKHSLKNLGSVIMILFPEKWEKQNKPNFMVIHFQVKKCVMKFLIKIYVLHLILKWYRNMLIMLSCILLWYSYNIMLHYEWLQKERYRKRKKNTGI